MASTYSVLDNIIRRTFHSAVHDLVNSEETFAGLLPREEADGSEIETIHRVGGSGSMGFITSDSDTLFTPDKQRWKNGFVAPMEFWATMGISQKLKATSKGAGAWESILPAEIQGLGLSIARRFEIYLMGDGTSTIGQVSGDPGTGTTFTLVTKSDARKFTPGDTIEFWSLNRTGATLRAGGTRTVSAVNEDTGVITVTAAINAAVADQDFVAFASGRIAGTTGTTRQRRTLMGIQFIDDKDTPMEHQSGFQEIKANLDNADGAQAGEATWASKVFSNSGTKRAVTDRLLQQACDAINIRSGREPDLFVAPFGPRLEYALTQTNIRRNMTNVIAAEQSGGFHERLKAHKYIEFDGRKILPHRFCADGMIFALTMSELVLKYWQPLQWWDDDGSIVRRDWGGKPHLIAEQSCYVDLCVNARNAFARIEDCDGTDPA